MCLNVFLSSESRVSYNNPFLSILEEHWRLGHHFLGHWSSNGTGHWRLKRCRTRSQCSILVCLHVGGHLFQFCKVELIELIETVGHNNNKKNRTFGDIFALVQLTKERTAVISSAARERQIA